MARDQAKKPTSEVASEDHIIVDKVGTDKQRQWITIKTASNMLGVSERRVWEIIDDQDLKTIKETDNFRLKTFVRQADIEKYLKQGPKTSPGATSEATSEVATSELRLKSEPRGLTSEVFRNFEEVFLKHQKEYIMAQKRAVAWKTFALCLAFFGVCLFGVVGYWLTDTKTSLAQSQESIASLNSKVETIQQDLNKAKEEASKQSLYIQRLEQNLPSRTLEELKGQ